MNKFIYLIIISCFFLTGCCTIKRQSYQLVNISSNPSGANIILDGHFEGVTPQTLNMEVKKSHHVTLEKEGYQTQEFYLKSKVSLLKLSSNFIFPLTGFVAGTGTGLIITRGNASGLFILPVGYCAAIGLGCGVGVGLIGAGIDLYTGNAKQLYHSEIKAKLQLQESCAH